MSSTSSVPETICDPGERGESAPLDSGHLIGPVPHLGTHILILPAAIRARQEGLGREEFLHRQIEQSLEMEIDQLELHFDAELLYPGMMKMAIKRLRQYSQEMIFSLHLPFHYLDISCPMERIRAASVDSILDAIGLAAELSPKDYIIHLTGNIFSYKSELDPLIGEAMGYVEESLMKITALVEPRQILVENLPQIDFHYFMPVVERMGLSICHDVGHTVLQGGDFRQFTRAHAPLIREIHLHDVERRYYTDFIRMLVDHQSIGRGIIDFESFVAMLGELGFDGSIILEINDEEQLARSVREVRCLMQSHFE